MKGEAGTSGLHPDVSFTLATVGLSHPQLWKGDLLSLGSPPRAAVWIAGQQSLSVMRRDRQQGKDAPRVHIRTTAGASKTSNHCCFRARVLAGQGRRNTVALNVSKLLQLQYPLPGSTPQPPLPYPTLLQRTMASH